MIILFGSLLLTLLIGVPIAVSIGFACLAYILFHQELPQFILAQRMIYGVNSFPLLALPLFIIAGIIMERTGATKRIMDFANSLVGAIPGGLAVVTVLSSMLFGGISGSGVADTAAIGGVVSPEMVRRGYGKGFTAALQAGAGVIGMIIPPSVPMVILGVSAGLSIGSLFLGGIIPGVIVGLMLILYSIYIARKRGYAATTEKPTFQSVWKSFVGAIWALIAPVIILGGIMLGIFTPTESAAVAIVYALILGFAYRDLSVRDLPKMLAEGVNTSAIVLLVISVASTFAWILSKEGIPAKLTSLLLSITDTPWMVLVLLNVVLLILGTFMETTAIIIITTPVFFPIIKQLGIDPIFFAELMIVNLAIGGVTPPLGVNLITSCRIINVKIEETFRDLGGVVGSMILALVILMLFPGLIQFLVK